VFHFAKVTRIITSIFFVGVLLLAYAYLPLTLDLNWEGFGRVDRSSFFYIALGTFITLNLITYFFRWHSNQSGLLPRTRLMIHLLPSVLFFALALLVGYVAVLNNAADVSPQDYNYLNFVSIILLMTWVVVFFYFFIRKQ